MMSASPALDLLGAHGDRTQARAAHLVQAPGGGLDGNAGGDCRLPRRVLSFAGGQHLTHDHFVDIGRRDVCPVEGGANGDLAKRMRRHARQRAVERANRRPRRADDDNIFVFHTGLHYPNISKVIPYAIHAMEAYALTWLKGVRQSLWCSAQRTW